MKLNYPKDLYADVRIETVSKTHIRYTKKELSECKVREYTAAFIRVFDGKKWYYCSTSDVDTIQKELDNLAALATPSKEIQNHPAIKRQSKIIDSVFAYKNKKITDISLDKKLSLLDSLHIYATDPVIKLYTLAYADCYKINEFYNSLGAAIKHDFQLCGFAIVPQMNQGNRQFMGYFNRTKVFFEDLFGFENELIKEIESYKDFLLNSEPVESGNYTLVFSPLVTGIFTHEIFGHKSEADAMVGDEATKKEWAIGKKLGMKGLNIIDSGMDLNSGYVPYDDEGNKAQVNYLVKDGVLAGRLHSASTAADFDEPPTGNARAITYEYEPIVRMTNTYIDKGNMSFDELIAPIKKGIYVKTVAHGSGLSTFTIAPSLAYMIEDGKITKPVRISVITGSVFETLGDIDGIGDDLKIDSSIFGGCGKMMQSPCIVADGGPSIRVNNMNVQ